MNDNKAVTIGTVIGGYRIYGICGEYCIAENIAPRTADSFAVWTIDNDKNGVHTGRYYWINVNKVDKKIRKKVHTKLISA